MHNPVAAIRAGRPRPHFATPQSRHRERQLGLARRARVTASAARRPDAVARPRDALRRAARSLEHPRPSGRPGRRGTHEISWSRRAPAGLGVARLRIAAPWRG